MDSELDETKEERSVELTCRLCLTEEEHYQPIFENGDNSVAEWIRELTSLEVTQIPDTPSSLCSKCKTVLEAFDSFRNACFANDKLFKELFVEVDQRNESFEEPAIQDVLGEDDRKLEDPISVEERGVVSKEDNEVKVKKHGQSSDEADYIVFYLDTCTDVIGDKDDKDQKPRRPEKTVRNSGTADASDGSNKRLCKVCNKFVSRLGQHQLIHKELKLLQCEFCSRRFNQMSNLKKHVRTHTKEKPYLCSWCDKGFTNSSELKVHIRSHTQEKPFKCNECNKSFVTSGHLVRHARSHSGEKPYLCVVCQARFSTSSHLVRHKRLHSGEYPYSCAACEERFMRTEYLKAHKCKL